MPKRTDNYGFHILELGDELFPGHDQQNMQTVENQIAGLYSFVTPGVYEGWEVYKMVPSGDTDFDSALAAAKRELIEGYLDCPYCYLGESYQSLGLDPELHLADVRAATTANITLSGAQTIDGVACIAGDRVLVKNQTTGSQNGIYVVAAGAWSRATDLDSSGELASGLVVRATEGTLGTDGIWALAHEASYILGTTTLNWLDIWAQTVRVTAGSGIVGLFTARTDNPYYFRYTTNGVYYVWMEAGLCLVSEGKAIASGPLDGDYDYNLTHTATYLATIEVATDDATDDAHILSITYDERRNNLKNLEGAADYVKRKYFYKHVHAGLPTTPSKIQLSTHIILNAVGPIGSTIFILTDQDGNNFSGNSASYGFPEVRLNNIRLNDSEYQLTTGAPWKLYLKNSLPEGSSLQVILPLFAQTNLFVNTTYSQITDNIVYLTDGVEDFDNNGDLLGYRVFKWDPNLYETPVVRMKTTNNPVSETIFDEDLYAIDPRRGTITFSPLISSSDPYNNESLTITLTKLGKEVTGRLSGRRIKDINAESFTHGTLSSTRIKGLDHVGQVRNQELAELRPYRRLLSSGDHFTFYPEIEDNSLQFNTEIFCMYQSANVSSGKILLGTKRGLMETSDYYTANLVNSWEPDYGQPVQIIDELLPGVSGSNHFKRTYVRTLEGKIYKTDDLGISWTVVVLPVPADGTTFELTSFWASSERTEETTNFIVTYSWSTNLYVGSREHGVWRALNTQPGDNPSWVQDVGSYLTETGTTIVGSTWFPENVHSLQEIILINTSTDSDGNTTETINRKLYSGSDSGFFIDKRRISQDIVKGFLWIQSGSANNNLNDLVWWTDLSVYLTHSAALLNVSSSTSSSSTWKFPLSETVTYSDCVAATTANITLSGTQTIDGVACVAGNIVLVKNQTNKIQNGIYVVAVGAWTRHSGLDVSAEYSGIRYVKVTSGTVNGGSQWVPDYSVSSFVLGDSDLVFRPRYFRALNGSTNVYYNVALRSQLSQYFALSENGIEQIIDTFEVGALPTTVTLPWDSRQEAPKALISVGNSGIGVQYVGGVRGIFKSTTNLFNSGSKPWIRVFNEFRQSGPTPLIFEELEDTLVEDWIHTEEFQSFEFDSEQPTWANYLYERDFTDYYVDPWIGTNADVFVYVNGAFSRVSYTLFPDEGLIRFSQSLTSLSEVKITIVRLGAFLSNAGDTPHEELPRSFVVASEAATQLSQALAPTDSIVVVENAFAFDDPANVQFLELRTNSGREKIPVVIDPETRQITIPYARASTETYAAGTDVHLVEVKTILGIEDIISKSSSGQTYNMNSLTGVNTIQLSIAAKDNYSGLFENFIVEGTNSDRGPKNALFFDFSTDEIDPRATSSSLYVGVEPSLNDSALSPSAVYKILSPSVSGNGMSIGTEQGIWIRENNKWKKESQLGDSARVYFLKTIGSYVSAGTDDGLWQKQPLWSENPAYPQAIFDHESGSWTSGSGDNTVTASFTAWGKDDGLAFVYQVDGEDDFTSDHFDAVDGKRVYGLYKDTFIRVRVDGSGNTTQENVDALYLCTELGLYGVTLGARGGQYSSILTGREMFGSDALTVPYTRPDGGVINVPVKIYDIFKSARPKSIPFIILTSNGVYRVRNWRWCDPDPTQPDLLDFHPESHHLDGVSCNIGLSIYVEGTLTTAEVNKCFIGTSMGVYRSYNEGGSWERCERMGGQNIPVYDLKTYTRTIDSATVIVAGTSNGLWLSADDGDTWERPSPTSDSGTYSFNPSTAVSFNGGYLAQAFESVQGATDVVKVSLYVSRESSEGIENYEQALDNYLQVEIWTTDVNGAPDTLISYGTPPSGITLPDTITAADIDYPQFVNLYANTTITSTDTFAVVVREVKANASLPSILRWHASTLDDPYEDGKTWQSTNGSVWSAFEDSQDFYFRVYLQENTVPIEETVPMDFTQGCKRGAVMNDTDQLTTEFKFALGLVVDDSHSIKWSDPQSRREVEIAELISTLWERTAVSAYDISYADFWVYGTTEIERSAGFINDLSALLTYSGALFERGNNSDLYDASGIVIAGLSKQSIVDAFLKEDDEDGNNTRVQALVSHLTAQSLLRLTDLQEWHAEQGTSDWDGTSGSIGSYDDISTYLITRWSDSFAPVAMIFSDGDGEGDAERIGLSATTVWEDDGAPVFTFGLGNSHKQDGLRIIAAESGGRHFDISDGNESQDWDDSRLSLLHGGDNNLFVATWDQEFDYETSTFIKTATVTFSEPTGTEVNSSCVVELRYTRDRINWTPWREMTSAVAFEINDEILAIQYRATLQDGWHYNGSDYVPVKPVISAFSHIEVTPSVQYIETYPYDVDGMIFEHLLSAAVDLPRTARANWAIGRTLSSDFAEFESVFNNRKGALPNRQQSLLFTEAVVRANLATLPLDALVRQYQVIEDGAPTNWATTDVVQVFVDDIPFEVDPSSYSLDANRGIVLFNVNQPDSIVISVTITTPEQLYTAVGEPSSTRDGRTYYATNGRWPNDAEVVVLVNGNIVRGGYWFSAEDGTVTFANERERTDIVTIFVKHVENYRVGVRIRNYSSTPVTLNNFGLYYSKLTNSSVDSAYYVTQDPSILGKVKLNPSDGTIYQRLFLDYTYSSPQGNAENGTTTRWYLSRAAGPYELIHPDNGFPDYNDRTVERLEDIGAGNLFEPGDKVYVVVTPSDGFSTGKPKTSNIVTLTGNQIPFVRNVRIQNSNGFVAAGEVLNVLYDFYDPDDPLTPNDESLIQWYERDSEEVFYVGSSIPAGITEQAQVFTCKITPYDGENYGIPITSDAVVIS